MNKVLCFGEILLRMSPDVNGDWLNQQAMPVHLGGAELNVAQALARWQIPVTYCSALPENYMSKSIRDYLQARSIGTGTLITSGSRIGIYYLAQGTDLKHAEVIYDRAHSSTAELRPGTIDWDSLLEGVSWFHFSAISPAINENVALVCREALQAAKRKDITVSVDLNYRSKLWKWGKQPVEVMPELVGYCDLVMGNIWAAELMLGVSLAKDFEKTKAKCIEQARRTSEEIVRQFPSCTQVANTFRFDQDLTLDYYGTLYKTGELFVSKEYSVAGIADKVGSGDCFMAGLVYGNNHHLEAQAIIDFAAAAAVDKMYVVGDATNATVERIERRINANVSRES